MSINKETVLQGCECKVCGCSDINSFDEVVQKGNYKLFQCNVCSFIFIPPYYRNEVSYADYKSEKVLEQIRKGDDWVKIQRHKLRFKTIRKYQRSGKLFDLGVGWGHFLYTGRLLGYETKGIELAENPYIYAKEDLKLNVDKVDFFDMPIEKESYDLLTMWDVLEHIDDCDLIIDRCYEMIKPDGYLILQVPQIDSFMAKKRKKSWTLMGLDHVNYFTPKTIKKLLEDRGFKVEKVKSSFEVKLFLMQVIFPLVQKRKQKKHKDAKVTLEGQQEYYNKAVNKPRWMLRLMVVVHDLLYNLLSFLNIGEEMIVVAHKK